MPEVPPLLVPPLGVLDGAVDVAPPVVPVLLERFGDALEPAAPPDELELPD